MQVNSVKRTLIDTLGGQTRAAAPILFLAGILLITFWPILFQGYTLYPSDLLHELYLPFAAGKTGTNVQVTSIVDHIDEYYSMYWFKWYSFHQGELPLWNPYVRGGHPAFASWGTTTTLNPFNILLLLPDLPTALAWRTFLQVMTCALFMYIYLCHLGLRPSASIAGSLGYTLNSMFWANIFDWSLSGFLWLPLILLLLDRAFEHRSLSRTALAGLVLGVGLLSSPLQIYFYICFTLAALYGLRWLILERSLSQLRDYLVYGLIAVAIGIGLSAVQLLPAMELIGESMRQLGEGGQEVRTPLETLIATGALITFVFPNLGGRIKDAMMVAQAWGGTAHWQGYIGLLPFLLAVLATIAGRDRRRWPFVVLAVLVVILVVFTPLVDYLYERFFLVYIFCMSVLAAFGAEAVASTQLDARQTRVVLRIVTGLFMVIALLYVMTSVALWAFGPVLVPKAENYMLSLLPGRYFGNNAALYLAKMHNYLKDLTLISPNAIVPLAVAFGALWLVRRRVDGLLSSMTFGLLAIGLIALDMSFATLTHVPLVDTHKFPLFPQHPAIEVIQRDPGSFRVIGLRQAGREPPVMDGCTLSPYGLQVVTCHDNLTPEGPASLALQPGGMDLDPPLDLNMADLLNIKYVMTGPQTELPPEHFERIYDREVRVYENLQVMPRAFFVEDFEVVSNSSVAMAELHSSALDPRQVVLLEQAPEGMMSRSVRETEGGQPEVSVLSYRPQEVLIRVKSTNDGFLVLSDTYYPGWKVTVDGQPSPILRANGVMRAVFVNAGEHWVRFAFEPSTFRAGLLISISAAVLVTILVVIGFLRRV